MCDPRGSGENIEPWPVGISLPSGTEKGSVVSTDDSVAYSVAADDAGRFALALKPSGDLLNESQTLYRFKVKLREVSNSKWIDGGAAVVLLPSLWSPDFDGAGGPLWSGETDTYPDCVAVNRQILSRFAKDPVALSGQLRAVAP